MEANEQKTTTGDWVFYLVVLAVFVGGTIYTLLKPDGHDPSQELSLTKLGVGPGWTSLATLIGAGLTLGFYSFLYKDNPFFKAAEHLYVGVGLGYLIVLSWFQYLKSELYTPLIRYWVRENWLGEELPGSPDYILIIPGVLGIMLVARLIPRLAWASRWSFAMIVGFGAGVAIPTYIQANILKQLEFTLLPIDWGHAVSLVQQGQVPMDAINMLVIIIGVASVLIYFYFSMEHRGVVGGVSKVGMWFLMICFGASFGYTVMGRMALFVGRVQFLIQDWLKLQLG